MKDLAERIAALSPEQRALFEARLRNRGLSTRQPPTVLRRKQQNYCRLSFDQERIWVVDQMEPGNPAYNIFSVSRLSGKIDVPLMERALNEIVRRHEIMRTTFVAVDGEPRQVIAPSLFVPLELIDLRALQPDEREREVTRLVNEETGRPFNLLTGPLVRFGLIREDDDLYVLHYTMHHTVTDRWSADVIEAEMVAIYMAFAGGQPSPLAELPIQYADFAEWQRDWLQGEVLEEHVAYWRNQLEGVPHVIELPTDRPRPPIQTFNGARRTMMLPQRILDALKALSRQEHATMFMTCLAAYKTLLHRYTNQEDILVGVAIANRDRPETLGLIGYFLNMLVMRTNFSGDPTFREVLRRERDNAARAFAHGEFPFGRLMQELKPRIDPSRNPLFQVAYIYLDFAPTTDAQMAGITSSSVQWDNGTSRFDMTLALTDFGDALEVIIEFNTDLFDGSTIERMLRHFTQMVEAIIADPDTRVARLPLLSDAERRRMLAEWNDTATGYPRHESIQHLFEEQAARTPDAPALLFDDERLTYAGLNERANRLAHHLRAMGVGAEVPVGVMLERSVGMVVALLAILKAGGAYVPLDPNYPLERLDFMLNDAGLFVLVTEDGLLDNLPGFFGQIVCLDTDAELISAASAENPPCLTTGEHLAYIVYTSGSTGRPKGISILHRAVVRLVRDADYIEIQSSDRIAQASNASFDALTFELWGALLNGAQLVGISKDVALTPADFAALIRERRISVMFLTTALFNQIAAAAPQSFATVREVLFGGEAVEPKWVAKVLEHGAPSRLLHVYGPTESTTFATWHEVGEVARHASTLPIGRPLSNTQVYLLDKNLEPVAVGLPGEIYIGGDGLARGYVRRPELTAERFIPHPFDGEAGARLYRTGDLARYLADGAIEFLGRVDNQVKVRGFRIELEEIEAALRMHPRVAEAVVLAREDGGEERRLVAYLVYDGEDAPTASEWRSFVGAKLPDYMIPSNFMMMESLPLTPNGKVNRGALPAPDQTRPELAQSYVAPTSPAEVVMAGIWAEMLGVERVGAHDSFFDLGGDSLQAIRVVSKAQERGLTISIHQLFEQPTVATLVQQIRLRETGAGAGAREHVAAFGLVTEEDRRLMPDGIEDAYPLTRLQAGMVFHSEYDPATAVYHDIFSFHLQARLDAALFRAAFDELMRRHPVLRTSFNLTGYSEPLQLVHEHVELPFALEDLTHLTGDEQRRAVAAYVEAEKTRDFDWSHAPLIRLHLQRRHEETFQFNLSFHHAILDGWSFSSMLNELFRSYVALLNQEGAVLGAPPAIRFSEFVALERAAMQSEEHRRFWLEKLDGLESTRVPRRPRERSREACAPEIRAYQVAIPVEVSGGLKRFSSAANVPLKSVLLAAHMRVLGLLSGRDDVVTGVVSNGRPEELDGDRMLGLFLNTLPFRLHLRRGTTWTELARRTFEAERAMMPYRRFPLTEMQRMAGARALFEVGFNYTHFHIAQGILQLKEMEILDLEAVSETAFPLLADFDLNLATSQVQLVLKYDGVEFSPEQIELIGGYYRRALAAMTEHPHERFDAQTLLSAAELEQQFEDWNDTTRDYPRDRSIHQLFEEQVERTPEAVAVVSENEELTYAELNARANQLAHYLRRRGTGAESVVGVMMERSIELVVALLGIVKAGGAYLPLDAEYPPPRLAFMLEDAGARLLLTERARLPLLPPIEAEAVCLDDAWRGELSAESERNPPAETSPDNLAYITYTSGSTGQPKGISVVHRGVVRLVKENDYARLDGDEVFLQFAPLAFDASTFEIWGSLLNGARLVVMPAGLATLESLGETLRRHRITTLWLTAGLFHLMVEHRLEDLRGLRQMLAGGDVLSVSHVERFLQGVEGCTLVNGYGPTENTTFTCCYRMNAPAVFETSVPIGRPVANTTVYILDQELRPVATGATGELYIGGDGLARGYLRRAGQTAERFIPHPFSRAAGARLYRTGDLARLLPDGNLEFFGRVDAQVKVRGHRIETGEIEATLVSHRAVGGAVVLAREEEGSEKRLVAYVVGTTEESEATAGELRQYLKERLPEYMLPASVVWLDEFPLTSRGKIDRAALYALDATTRDIETVFVEPRTPTEKSLARIWSKVLGVERVGADADFFDAGGNSLSATQLVSLVRQSFDIELPLRELFKHPTLAQSASVIEQAILRQMDELTDEEAEQLLKEGF